MTSAATWALIGACAAVTAAIKAAGPVALGGRDLPGWFTRVIALMAPTLLAALVCVSALAHGDRLAVGSDTAGVAIAGVVLWRGGSVVAGVAVAVAVTAALRAL
ncbi:MAG: AzlD domain-containing protein [Actinobacteria bacterium]|nr:MAG: AzlD domain-containing protein [Actinomycetota bacterium]